MIGLGSDKNISTNIILGTDCCQASWLDEEKPSLKTQLDLKVKPIKQTEILIVEPNQNNILHSNFLCCCLIVSLNLFLFHVQLILPWISHLYTIL